MTSRAHTLLQLFFCQFRYPGAKRNKFAMILSSTEELLFAIVLFCIFQNFLQELVDSLTECHNAFNQCEFVTSLYTGRVRTFKV